MLASSGKLSNFASRGYRLSPHLSYSEGGDESDDEELAEIVRSLSTNESSPERDSSQLQASATSS